MITEGYIWMVDQGDGHTVTGVNTAWGVVMDVVWYASSMPSSSASILVASLALTTCIPKASYMVLVVVAVGLASVNWAEYRIDVDWWFSCEN
jgi:hypothetical protein